MALKHPTNGRMEPVPQAVSDRPLAGDAIPYRPDPQLAALAPWLGDRVEAADFPQTVLRWRNDRAAAQVGLAGLSEAEWIAHFGRFAPLPGNLTGPLALRYHGHQFGVYNPDLGDGRGFTFAQMRDGAGRLMDLGTKGSGQTPWSRRGDGRLTLKGAVREILFEEGQAVKKGQVLVKIDDSDLRAQVAQAESRFRMAESNLQRNEALLKTSFITQADFDRISNDYTAAKYDLALLTVRLNRTELKAPFDGVVNARALSPGDYITNQTVVTTIDDLSRLKIDFQVPERYQGKVNPGTKFTVTAGSVGGETETATGEVYFVSSSIDRSTRSIQVKGTLLAPSQRLRPGMFANVEVVLEVRSGVLTVPEGAILATPNLVQVIAVRSQGGEHVVEYVPVKLGLRTRGLTEIVPVKGNLAENDRVVAAGVGAVQLFAGARVDPKPLNSEFQVAE